MALSLSRGFKFTLYGLAVFVLAASMYALAKPSLSGGVPDVAADEHIKGSPSSAVTLIEYSDFQCPACQAYEAVVDEIVTKYSDRITFVYRHFPLVTIHPNAEMAARASEAAANQGKFWEMHDLLFDRQDDWSALGDPTTLFVAYAELLALDKDQFISDLSSSDVRDRVRADMNEGNAAGINATPTFYLNGEPVTFPRDTYPGDYLSAEIDRILGSATE